jgi:hypothetical protein
MKEIFNPCEYCVNVMTEECFKDCVHEGQNKHFKLRTGTGIKDLPAFPLEEVLNYADARARLVIVSTYLAAITDYLQHQDEYEFRENAPEAESKLPEEFRRNLKFPPLKEINDEQRNYDRTRSGRISKNVKRKSLQDGSKRGNTQHEDRKERQVETN